MRPAPQELLGAQMTSRGQISYNPAILALADAKDHTKAYSAKLEFYMMGFDHSYLEI